MPANVYECMFLLDTNKVAGDVPAAVQKLHAILEKQSRRNPGQPAVGRTPPGLSHQQPQKGSVLPDLLPHRRQELVGIEHDCALNEMILRMLVIHVDPKLVEPMLAMARDEHAVALQTVTEPPPDEDGMGAAATITATVGRAAGGAMAEDERAMAAAFSARTCARKPAARYRPCRVWKTDV